MMSLLCPCCEKRLLIHVSVTTEDEGAVVSDAGSRHTEEEELASSESGGLVPDVGLPGGSASAWLNGATDFASESGGLVPDVDLTGSPTAGCGGCHPDINFLPLDSVWSSLESYQPLHNLSSWRPLPGVDSFSPLASSSWCASLTCELQLNCEEPLAYSAVDAVLKMWLSNIGYDPEFSELVGPEPSRRFCVRLKQASGLAMHTIPECFRCLRSLGGPGVQLTAKDALGIERSIFTKLMMPVDGSGRSSRAGRPLKPEHLALSPERKEEGDGSVNTRNRARKRRNAKAKKSEW